MKNAKRLMAAMLFLALSGSFLVGFWIWRIDQKWSPILQPRIQERQQFGSIRILAKDSNNKEQWISSLSSGRLEERKTMSLSEMPPILVQAIVHLEDPRFLDHEGFDVWGILRAAFAVMRTMRFSQGGSTITQQLVKNIFLSQEKTLSRKFVEIVISALVEKRFTKDEILEAYLNEVYMGQLGPLEIHGIGRASDYYFNKSLDRLELHEMALIAAVIASPGYYSPWKHPERAQQRRERVLRTLFENDLILEEEFIAANLEALPKVSSFVGPTRANYLVDALRAELLLEKGEAVLLKGGFDISLSLDLELQKIAEKSLMAFSQQNPEYQGLVVAANPQDCSLHVYAGGTDYKTSQLDRIRQSKRSIGSLMKPLEVLRLLDNPDDPLTLASILEDRPLEWNYDNNRGKWEPQNYDLKFRGNVRLRQALEESLNVPISRIFFDRKPNGLLNDFFDPVRALGLKIDPDRALPSAILGSIEQRPWDVLEAYTKLVRQSLGLAADPADFRCRLHFEKGKDDAMNPPEEPFGQIGARLMMAALEGALRRGTSRWLGQQLPGNQAWAGKTGTSSDKRDSWYVSLSPHLVTLAWVGKDNNEATSFTGATGALPLVAPIVKEIAQRPLPLEGWQWPFPLGLSWEPINMEKGCLQQGFPGEEFKRRFESPLDPLHLPQELLYHDGRKFAYELFDETKLPEKCRSQ